MSVEAMRVLLPPVLSLCVAFFGPALTFAQKGSPEKFNDAIKRSRAGAETIGRIALADQGISKRLIDSAEAVGVFPCHKKDALLEYAVFCPGVISRRLQSGWSTPIFYKFGGGGFGRPDKIMGQSQAIILVFIDKQSVDWLNKSFKFEEDKQAYAGKTGPLTEADVANLTKNFHILAYSMQKDGLKGVILSGAFERVIAIDQDNHINQSLYGVKGSEILAGKEITTANGSPEIFAFKEALQKHFPK